MSSVLFDGRKLVQMRHCRELARLLSKNMDRWNEFRSALGVPLGELKDVYDQVKECSISGEAAFYAVVHHWVNRSPKTATFGSLIDILARQLEFLDAANRVMELEWN